MRSGRGQYAQDGTSEVATVAGVARAGHPTSGQQPGSFRGFRVGRYEGRIVNTQGNAPGKAQLDLLSISATGAVRAHLREFDGLEGEGDLTGAINTLGVLELRGPMRSPSDGSVWQSTLAGVLLNGVMRFGQRLTLNGQEQQETATLAFAGAPTVAAAAPASAPAPARTTATPAPVRAAAPTATQAPAAAPAPTAGVLVTGRGPQPGVYACYGQRGPALPAQFGIIDGRTYANFDAETGRYVLANGILTMTTGPMAGFRYRHTQSTPTDVFRMLDDNGAFTAYNCPWQRGDARRGHW